MLRLFLVLALPLPVHSSFRTFANLELLNFFRVPHFIKSHLNGKLEPIELSNRLLLVITKPKKKDDKKKYAKCFRCNSEQLVNYHRSFRFDHTRRPFCSCPFFMVRLHSDVKVKGVSNYKTFSAAK
ncbi:hypothetical protein ISCGN_027534 [Ixodes scapularis]